MTNGRGTAAESVSSLLEIARTRQRSGLLSIEYSQGGFTEAGEVYLVAGQPIYARVGNLAGSPALHRLLSWRNISFAFAANALRPPANIFPPPGLKSTEPNLHLNSRGFIPLPTTDKLRQSDALRPEQAALLGPGAEHLVPRKVEPVRDIASLSLTRRQRLIYFLVDGQRTVADLVRTANKTVLEIGATLGELQQQGLITF